MKKAFYLFLAPVFLLWIHHYSFAPPVLHTAFGDPDYGYLLNSLMIVEGKSPNHIDHPGTTVQLLGALVIKILYLFDSSGRDIIDSVLTKPYQYLYATSLLLALILASSSFYLGRALQKTNHAWWIVVLAQLSPLLLPPSWYYLTRVTPEIFIVATALLIAAVLTRGLSVSSRLSWKACSALGLLIGLGIASKISFAPLLLLLLLAQGWRAGLAGGIATTAAFTLVTIPIWSQYGRLFSWLLGIFRHTDNYGLGAPGFIGGKEHLLLNLSYLMENCRGYFLLGAYLVAASLPWLLYRRNPNSRARLWHLSLAGLIIATLLFMVLKQVATRYLLPAIAIWAWILPTLLKEKFSPLWRTYAIGISIATFSFAAYEGFSAWWLILHNDAIAQKHAVLFNEQVRRHSHCARIISPPVWEEEFPLYGGDLAVGGRYTARLQKIYPGTIFYDIYPGQFRSFAQLLSPKEVQKLVSGRECVIVEAARQINKKSQTFMVGAKAIQQEEIILPFELEPILEMTFVGIYRVKKFK